MLGHQALTEARPENPAAPRDVTPPSTSAGGYWGWYYETNYLTGFNWIAPMGGKFWGSYFYRTAHSLFDVHVYSPTVRPLSPAGR